MSNACLNGGTYVSTSDGGYYCVCHSGFDGITCEKNVRTLNEKKINNDSA